MKALVMVTVLLLTACGRKESVVIKGTTVLLRHGKFAFAGVKIDCPKGKIHTVSNIDGRFSLSVPPKQRYDIWFSMPDEMPALHLVNLIRSKQDTLDLDIIEMIPHKSISIEQFQELSNKAERKIAPVYNHHVNPIGYFLMDEVEVEAVDLLIDCPDRTGKVYNYSYDSNKHIITIDYQKIKECR